MENLKKIDMKKKIWFSLVITSILITMHSDYNAEFLYLPLKVVLKENNAKQDNTR